MASNEYSALKVVDDSDNEANPSYSYYINMDNIYLQSELKASKENLDLIRARWEFGMMLVALALLRPGGNGRDADRSSATESESEPLPQDEVYKVTAAIAPVLLPLIEHLGALSNDDIGVDD